MAFAFLSERKYYRSSQKLSVHRRKKRNILGIVFRRIPQCFDMFEEVISPTTKKSLERVSSLPIFQSAYLAGGTALALQLGHRYSHDLDFFSPEEFDEQNAIQQIANALPDFSLERQEWRTILGFVGDIRFSLFFYQYPLLFPAREFYGIVIADAKDIAAMKIAALAGRGTKRDFIDLYVILQEKHLVSLEDILELYDKKFGKLAQNNVHIIKSLGYFESADSEAMPQMIKEISWEEVKKFFFREQQRIASKML